MNSPMIGNRLETHQNVLYNLLSHCLNRYASLYFCVAIEPEDNELISLEIIHRYVELLDKYFGSVSWIFRTPSEQV